MDSTFWDILKRFGTKMEVEKGYYLKLHTSPSPSACVYLLDEGICSLNSMTRKGDENIYLYFHAKRLIGFNHLLTPPDSKRLLQSGTNVSIVTKTACVLYQINYEIFFHLLQTNSEFNMFFIQTLADNYSEALNHFHYMHEESLVTALCQLLLSVCRRPAGSKPSIPKFYTYEELARYLGCHPVTVSRIMAKLKQQGYLKKAGRELTIEDEDRLIQLMESEIEFKY